ARFLHLRDRERGPQPHRQLLVDHPVGYQGLVVEQDLEELPRLLAGYAVLQLTPAQSLGVWRDWRRAARSTKPAAICQHDAINDLREMHGRVERDARTHGVPDE